MLYYIDIQNKIDLSIYTRCLIMLILQRFTSCFSLITLTVQVLELLYLTFSTRVNKAVKGWGTNDNLLIRVLVARDEIDMPEIKQYYKQLYGKDMLADIKSDCSGDYQRLLIELAGH